MCAAPNPFAHPAKRWGDLAGTRWTMTRLIRHDAQGPALIQVGENTIAVCQCGLSANKPFCDGGHTRTRDEESDVTYAYDAQGNRIILENLFPTIVKKVEAPA